MRVHVGAGGGSDGQVGSSQTSIEEVVIQLIVGTSDTGSRRLVMMGQWIVSAVVFSNLMKVSGRRMLDDQAGCSSRVWLSRTSRKSVKCVLGRMIPRW